MPPKPSTRRSAPKTEDKEDKPIQKDQEPKTRTRGRQLDKSASKDVEPVKKIKLDEEDNKKAKTEPKKTKSKDLSASKKKDEAEDKPVLANKPAKQPAKQSAKQPAKQDLKKVILKGSIPVDQYFSQPTNYKVYSNGGMNYAKTLNQSNIQNNNNKFYILQILQNETNPTSFMFFTRWGRVGVEGQMANIPCFSAQVAIREFNRKLRDKLNGGYRQVQMNYQQGEEKKQSAKQQGQKKTDQPEIQSNLPKTVQDLVRLIFDMKMMNNQMKQIGYDAKKMPLGKLAKNSILRGYEALKGLMEEVKGKKRHDVLARLTGDFYSEIPHDFGFSKMQNFILDTEQKVKQKLQMLQSLQDIQIFTKLLDQGKISSDMNELDSNYLKLNTNITPLDKQSDTYKLLLQYVQNTHASTHTSYKLEVQEIFELSKDLENSRFRKDINNKQLLWHGSRLTNFVGILSQGLRIAPPQAPVTGYMFGKGVYFADMVTKSANYCFTNSINNTGLMLLCEVALGETNQKFYADYYANLLPPNKFSTKGVGRTAPDGGKYIGDVFVPCGRSKDVGVGVGTSLMYNEFIVYDIAQIKSRYLFKMKFNYNYRRGIFG